VLAAVVLEEEVDRNRRGVVMRRAAEGLTYPQPTS
jgi:hypothetical protein